MKVFKKLKSFLSFEDSIDLTRRKFITDAASLAALTVVALNAPSLLKVKEIQSQLEGGRVFGQTFYLTEPIIIDLPNTIIDNCTFIAVEAMPYMVHITKNAKQCVIKNSRFEAKNLADTCIDFVARTDDMTNTIQQALYAACDNSDVTVYFKPGIHKISSPLTIMGIKDEIV